MLRSLLTAASGMMAQQFNVDTISNNLANANTTGFKKIRPEFQDLLYLNIQQPVTSQQGGQSAASAPSGLFIGLGVRDSGSQTIFSQGNLESTSNPLDVGISGPGFFTVSPDSSGSTKFYTRDGSFKLDASSNLVTSDGYHVLDDSGAAIQVSSSSSGSSSSSSVDTSSITIGSDGTIGSQKLGVAEFANPGGLEHVGHNLYQATATSGDPTTQQSGSTPDYTIEQDYLESSNVQAVEEMVNLITAQRAYELNSKAVTASDQMLSMANNLRGS
ncbi:MAG: flagellar basal-body rod protein FlgG [Thermacetogeniaceae bacterium]